VLTDYFGDGLCCGYGEGHYRLSDSDGNVIAEGAELENRIDHYFINGELTSRAEELLVGESFSINPTLVDQSLNIDFNLASKSEIQIVVNDVMGNEVLFRNLGIRNIGNHQNQIEVAQLTNGIYFVNLYTDEGLMTQRIVKL
jgi:hypothetical protein